MKSLWTLSAALLLGLSAATAQTAFLCDHQGANSYSETREINLPFSGAVDVSTSVGAISVQGWDNAYVLVRAHIGASADDEYQARLIAGQVQIDVSSDRIQASGPVGKSWGVGFEVFVPREAGVRANTHVGAVSVADVTGKIFAQTSVGALTLTRLGGDVEAKTGVGAISVALSGAQWEGKGLTAATGTGAIRITAAPEYIASFDLRTNLGKIASNFPEARVMPTSFLGRKLVFGSGAPIQATTSIGQIELVAVRAEE